MKIRVYSDIHLEFGKFKPEAPVDPDTVLILAGDIGVKLSALQFIEREAPKYLAVIYIAGNHEFYNANMDTTLARLKAIDHIPNLHFMENDSLIIGGHKFIGATLWTDYNNDSFAAKYAADKYMNDFKCITYGRESRNIYNREYLTPTMCLMLHRESLAFFKKELEKDSMPTIVISHHAPTLYGTNHERYGRNEITYSYYTDLEYLMEKHDHLTHWIFGHSHKSLDMDIYGTRVISNPRGYLGHEINPQFNPTMEILV